MNATTRGNNGSTKHSFRCLPRSYNRQWKQGLISRYSAFCLSAHLSGKIMQLNKYANIRRTKYANFRITEYENIWITKYQNKPNMQYQNIQTSEYANIRICKYQNIQTSEYPNIRICKYQNMQTSEYANIRISKHQNMQISEYANIRISKHQKTCRYQSKSFCYTHDSINSTHMIQSRGDIQTVWLLLSKKVIKHWYFVWFLSSYVVFWYALL